MSEMNKPIENSLESLSMTIPFSCRDWAQEKRDAWVFGIVCGWGDDCRTEFEKKFGWNAETFDRLKRLHAHFEEVRRAQPENEPLTLDELKQMDGEPVWVDTGEVSIGEQLIGRWQICYGDSDGMDRNHKPCRGISFSNGNWKPSDMHGKTWLAYRSKPKEDV